jgi:hypothetical protein
LKPPAVIIAMLVVASLAAALGPVVQPAVAQAPALSTQPCAPESEDCAEEQACRAGQGCAAPTSPAPTSPAGESIAPPAPEGDQPPDGEARQAAPGEREPAPGEEGEVAVARDSSRPLEDEGGELPFTGLGIGAVALAGLALLGGGRLLRRVGARPGETE